MFAMGLQPAMADVGPQDLSRLSIEDLGNVLVSSVAKRPQPLATAPSSVYVISHDDIIRSGARNLPEALRLAPNLEVFRTSPSDYVIAARGLSGSDAAQNFPNKLLVLIDGRSVYSPIFSGMYWDDQYVLPENVERIEVISGPGGALWGANAVNGVINIITRDAATTTGTVITASVGNLQHSAAVQYGGALGDSAHYRVYARDLHVDAFDDQAVNDARNGSHQQQAGARLDWELGPADTLMAQGYLHQGREGQSGTTDRRNAGGSVLVRWRRASEASSIQLQAYYDHVHRWADASGGGFYLDTGDIELQQDLAVAGKHKLTWGIGDRIYHYKIIPRIGIANSLLWDPAVNTQNLANAFVQDQVALSPHTQLTLGLKAENDPYSGVSLMPSVRMSWAATGQQSLWAAASRAVRTPTPFDEDVVEQVGSQPFLVGNPHFRREKLTAFEAGWRMQFATRATLSLASFYHAYDDLKSIEFSPAGLPLLWGNGMAGHSYGVEAWGSYEVNDWWRLSAGITAQRQRFHFKSGASGLLGVSQAGNDPRHYGFIRSSMNLSDRWMLDANVREVAALPEPHLPGYVELDARLAWRASDTLDVALIGTNLLHDWHQERVSGDRIGRSLSIDLRLKLK
ncbi:TonB-dependent receptor plug domain-containing protein [Dyella sp.]|jgi:iron complex outermembrane receptor protein|uniref:TonB-dependent receptor plug domain-containing protein n=1 Tax=Dyella sp. TaxID=1869338 RepID=UPI002D76D72F|nr:TonB-dependent receptor [Dyella sp.]HET6432146.1 TonB-dependent receptor [Dyella sp.]